MVFACFDPRSENFGECVGYDVEDLGCLPDDQAQLLGTRTGGVGEDGETGAMCMCISLFLNAAAKNEAWR